MKGFLIFCIALLFVCNGSGRTFGLDAATERRALRAASGVFGKRAGFAFPTGWFSGRVKHLYQEHASAVLMAKSGSRRSTLRVNVWNGADHVTRLVGITARVRAGGKVVALSGGRVAGKGLLPYGIRVQRGRVNGTVRVRPGKPRLVTRLNLSGIDLANGNAPVRGSGTLSGRKR